MAGISGCGSKVDQKYLDRLTNIRLDIDTAAAQLTKVNYDSIHKKFQLFSQTSERISKNFYELKTDESFPILALYRECKKPLREVASKYPIFQRDVDTSRVQVDRLQHDMEASLLKETEIEQYLLIEEQNAALVKKKIVGSIANALKYEQRFDTIHPKVIKFLAALKDEKK
jgi:hypothetical protein